MINENTTKKGDTFENKVYGIIQELLLTDEFYVSRKKSRLYSKKGYYSERRKSDIVVDISIETYIKNTDKFSILTVIECKNYGKKGVPVDDVEEFDSKLNQIGEHNTKGIIVANSHFQKGAINLAKSKKIGLIRINENNKVDWVNFRKDRKINFSMNSVESKLSTEILSSNFIGLFNQKSFFDLPSVLIEIGAIDKYINKPRYINIPYRSDTMIDTKIKDLGLYKFYSDGKLDSDQICKHLKNKYKLSFDFKKDLGLSESNKVLGKMTYKPLKISITKELLSDKNRWRFTLAHEIGHFILHYDYLSSYFDETLDNEITMGVNVNELYSFNNIRLEIQANIFASRLLIPQNKLMHIVNNYFIRERINKGRIYFDRQKCNIQLATRLFWEIEKAFGVSKEAAKIRLISSGLLIDATDISLQRFLNDEKRNKGTNHFWDLIRGGVPL